jgi:glutathione S-transferase
MSIIIYSAPQTRGVLALWAAEELGIPYERVKVDFAKGEHKGEAFTKINPNQRLPAMVVDGRPMFESTAMVLFLAEKFGPEKKLSPTDDASRAEAMGWTVWGAAQLGHNIHQLMMASHVRVPKEMHNEARTKASRADIEKDLGVLDARLARHPFVMGDAFTLADVVPASAVFFATMGGVDVSSHAHVSDWAQRLGGREALKRAQSY